MYTALWNANKHRKIIGFCGLKGTGKGVAAHALDDLGYVDCQFSEGLKVMLRAFLTYQGVTNPEMYTDDWLKNHHSRYFNNKTFRHAMQTLGTEWGREFIGSQFWINAWVRRIESEKLITVSDVRFSDEVRAIRERGGIVIKIRRPSYLNLDEHVSETNMEILKCDYEVVNQDLKEFQEEIKKIEREHFKK